MTFEALEIGLFCSAGVLERFWLFSSLTSCICTLEVLERFWQFSSFAACICTPEVVQWFYGKAAWWSVTKDCTVDKFTALVENDSRFATLLSPLSSTCVTATKVGNMEGSILFYSNSWVIKKIQLKRLKIYPNKLTLFYFNINS